MKSVSSLDAYLKASEYINFFDGRIQARIRSFEQQDEIERIIAVFEFVRDKIHHSYDINSTEVTRKASDVLQHGHGICYAKSHLFAALLRGMGIPAGICYQRLTLYDKPEDGHCIHALNTVYVRDLNKWIRLDARGNKKGIDAQFSIDEEKLAFPIREGHGEKDYKLNYSEPHPAIIKALETYSDCMEMYQQGLPDQL
jgi:transglutaminase-like putative cysteine protease